MANIKIAVINQSTVVNDTDAQNITATLQTQVTRDFAPVWGIDAQLTFFKKKDLVPAGYWWLIILDNSDQAGALGYHDLTNEGLPLGKVFAKSDLQYGYQWSVTASHELLEMLGDPDINLCAFVQKGTTAGTLYAYEVCDACEADQFGYKIGNVLVSDFVYPEWFEDMNHVAGTQYDHQKKVMKPFQLLKGGYISIYRIIGGQGWAQLNAEKDRLEYPMRAKVGTRRERRRTLREQWLMSDAKHGADETDSDLRKGNDAAKRLFEATEREKTVDVDNLTATLHIKISGVKPGLSTVTASCNGEDKSVDRGGTTIVFENVTHGDAIDMSGNSAGTVEITVSGVNTEPDSRKYLPGDPIIGGIMIL